MSVLGPQKAQQYVALQRDSLIRMQAKLTVSVAPDSMKPKDEISQMNLATDMFAEVLGPPDALTDGPGVAA